MKLPDIYRQKYCPRKPGYVCDNAKCAKFISCMIEEIDAFYAAGGITQDEANDLDRQLVKMVRNDNDGT